MKLDLARIQAQATPLLRRALHHLRHPTRRGILWGIAAIPALCLLYVLVLIPLVAGTIDEAVWRLLEAKHETELDVVEAVRQALPAPASTP